MSFLLEDFLTILYDDTLEVACNLLTSQVEDSTLSNLVLYGRNASFVNLGRCNLDRRYQDITSARVLLEGVRACGETEFNDIAVFCSYVIMSIVRTVYVNIALTIGSYTFVRSTKTELKFIEVDTADALTYSSCTLFDITVIAESHNTNTDYTPNTLVTRNNKLWRAIHGNRGILPENNRVWQETKVADVLGRVKYGTEDAVVDPNNQYKWTVKNNALTEIHYQGTSFTPDLEFDVRITCDEVPNFVIEINPPNGGLVTVKIIKSDPSTSPPTESYTLAHYSKSAGNSIPANKNVQITCVGKCWTWEEYIDPTSQQT